MSGGGLDRVSLTAIIAWFDSRLTADECRRALGLADNTELQRLIEHAAGLGERSARRELRGRQPVEATPQGENA